MKKKFNIKWWLAQHKNQTKDSVDVDESEGYVGYPLTAEEQEEKEQLLEERKKDFNSFIRACEKYGHNDVKGNASEMEGKTEEEVERYAEVFKERYKDLNENQEIDEREMQARKEKKLAKNLTPSKRSVARQTAESPPSSIKKRK
ncbi:hypothetical protein AgCh_002076 [Apium graveolens]